MSKKVLFTASTSSHILNFHIPYLKYYHDAKWEVHAAAGGRKTDIPYADKTLWLPFKKSMGAEENFKAAGIIREAVKKEGYGFICTHTSLAAFFTRLALKGMKKRPAVANMVHGYLFDDNTPFMKKKLLLSAERFTAPQTDLLLTMNGWDFKTAERYKLGKKTAYIPGIGVDFSKLDPGSEEERISLRNRLDIPDKAFVLTYAAEFSKRKNQGLLIRAMQLLPENVVLVLAGDGDMKAECAELARSLGVSGKLRFPGHVKRMGLLYAISDAAVTSSRSEGLPFNVMEAMYMGLPVAASAVKGHIDLIRDKETGLLYPYGDAPAFAECVKALMASEDFRLGLSDRAKNAVSSYSLDKVLPQVIRYYESVYTRQE